MPTSSKRFWEKTYQSQISKLIGVCYRYVGNRQIAEDLTHDAFLKAIENAKSFEGRGSINSWLRKIVVNEALQYIRKQKSRPTIEHLNTEYHSLKKDDSSHQGEEEQKPQFSSSSILDTITELPEHHRLVFSMYVLDDFKHSEIAEMLGISVGTSKSHLSRARKKLRVLLNAKVKKAGLAVLIFSFSIRLRAIDKTFRKACSNFKIQPLSSNSIDLKRLREDYHQTGIRPRYSNAYAAFTIGTTIIIVSTILIIKNTSKTATISDNTILMDSIQKQEGAMKDSIIAGSLMIATLTGGDQLSRLSESHENHEKIVLTQGNNHLDSDLYSMDSSYVNFQGENYTLDHCIIVNESYDGTSKWEIDLSCCKSLAANELSFLN